MKTMKIILAVLSIGVMGGVAGAAGKPTAAPVRVKNVEIESEQLKGELPMPLMDSAQGRRPADEGSLIRARADFLREIVKSAEDL